MALKLTTALYNEIAAHLMDAYPNEGAGLLLGKLTKSGKEARIIIPLENKFASDQLHHRYLITSEDMREGETTANANGFEILGVYHSHPEHPAEPSDYDRTNAWPWYSYLIVSMQNQQPSTARCWCLAEDRSEFNEEELLIET